MPHGAPQGGPQDDGHIPPPPGPHRSTSSEPPPPPPVPPAPPKAPDRAALPPPPPQPPAPAPPPGGQDRHGPVKLAGSVAIGPGPRVADSGAHATAPLIGTDWIRRAGGSAPADGRAALPAARPQPPAQWRPWRFRMSNDVWGTPVVFNGRLYVLSFEVHALDVATGRREFKSRDVAWTMAVADGRVHASDGPNLYTLDAGNGADLWRVTPDGWVYSIQAGGGLVCTGTRGGGVQVWDAATGELRWRKTGAQTEFESPDSGPSLFGQTVYYHGRGRLYAVDALSGQMRWSYVLGEEAAVARSLEADGITYVTAGTRVFALDAASGAERWRYNAPAVIFTPPVLVPKAASAGGGIYVADYLGTVYAIDTATGRDRWRVATESRQGSEPVVVEDGTVYIGSGNALYTLDAVTGAPRWRFAAQREIVGRPVVADGRVHFGSKDHCLYTVDAAGGQLRWKLETGGEITGSPVVADGVVYACSTDRCVYALDAVKGTGTGRAAAGRG